MPQIELVRPLQLSPTGGSELTITNRGSGNVYYGRTSTVSSTQKIGTLIPGEALTFSRGFVWVVAQEPPVILDLRERQIGVSTETPATENAFTDTITMGSGNANPHGIAITPDGEYVYVCCYGENTLKVVRTGTNTIVAEIGSLSKVRSVVITPDGTTALAINYGPIIPVAGKLWVIDIATNTVTREVAIAKNPHNLAVTPDGTKVLVACSGSSGAEKGLYPVSIPGYTVGTPVATGYEPWGVCVLPNGKAAYITSFSEGVIPVAISSTGVLTEGALIPITGSQVQDIVASKDSTMVYAAGYLPVGCVIPIKVASNTTDPSIPVGGGPSYLALSPDGKTLWVATYLRLSMVPIDLASYRLGKELFCYLLTVRPEITPDGKSLYCSCGIEASSPYMVEFSIDGPGELNPVPVPISIPATATLEGTAETMLVTIRIPGPLAVPGTTLTMRARGTIAAAAAAKATITTTIRLGTTGTLSDAVVAEAVAGKIESGTGTAFGWNMAGDTTCQIAGNQGTFIGNLQLVVPSGLVSTYVVPSNKAAVQVVDTTKAFYVTLSITPGGVTSPIVKVTNALVEIVAI